MQQRAITELPSYSDLLQELQECDSFLANSAKALDQVKQLIMRTSRQQLWKDINHPGGGVGGIWAKDTLERRKCMEEKLHLIRAHRNAADIDRGRDSMKYLPPHRSKAASLFARDGPQESRVIMQLGPEDIQRQGTQLGSFTHQIFLKTTGKLAGEEPGNYSLKPPPRHDSWNRTSLNPTAPPFIPPPEAERPAASISLALSEPAQILDLSSTSIENSDTRTYSADLWELVLDDTSTQAGKSISDLGKISNSLISDNDIDDFDKEVILPHGGLEIGSCFEAKAEGNLIEL